MYHAVSLRGSYIMRGVGVDTILEDSLAVCECVGCCRQHSHGDLQWPGVVVSVCRHV